MKEKCVSHLSPSHCQSSVLFFRRAAVFCFCLTQNRWQEELKRISEERRGRRDKRCLSPPRSRETQGEEGGRNEAQACQGARPQTPSLPVPLAQPALHPSSAHLFRDRDMKANCRSKAGLRALGFFVRSLTSPLCPGFPRSRLLTTLYASHIALLDDSITPSPSHLHFKPPLAGS